MGSYQGQDMLELRRGAKGPCFWLLAPALPAGLSLLSCKHSPAQHICYNISSCMPQWLLSPLAWLWHLVAPDTEALPCGLTRVLQVSMLLQAGAKWMTPPSGGSRQGTDELLQQMVPGWCDPWESKAGKNHGGFSGQENGCFREGTFL